MSQRGGGFNNLFGSGQQTFAPEAGGWYAGTPVTQDIVRDDEPDDKDPLVTWARNTAAVLKREKQTVLEQQRQAVNLYTGGTPWWKTRPQWKIGTRLNYIQKVCNQWASILSDNKPSVTYSAYRREDQRIADIATAAFLQAYEEGAWQGSIRNAILLSRIVKKGYLRLTFDPACAGGPNKPVLTAVSGEQVFVDKNALDTKTAEILMYEYRESYGKVVARFPKVAGAIARKRTGKRDYGDQENGTVLAEAATYDMPTGTQVNTPPYAATPNAPDQASRTSGIQIREFWTRPRKTIDVESVLFTAAGEPASHPKMIQYADGTEEPLRRVFTEGGVIYELPESLVPILRKAEEFGGLRIEKDLEAFEIITHYVSRPLYPEGRLVTIVDDTIKADDRMNPLGYIPFVEIASRPNGIDYWGTSDPDIIADPYEYLVRLVSMILDAANLTANPVWRLPLSSEMSDEDITNAPGAIMREDVNSLRYGKREAGPEMPSYVMNLIRFMVEQINDLSGLNEVSMGKTPPKGQLSTDTMSMQQDAAGVGFRDALHNIEIAMVELGHQFLELVGRFYTEPVLIGLKTDAGVTEGVPLMGTHLTATLKVQAKPGSMLPNSPTARLTTMMNLMGSGQPLVDLPEVWSLLAEVGAINSATGLQQRITKEMANPKTMWLVPGHPVNGQPSKGKNPKKAGSKRSKKGNGAG